MHAYGHIIYYLDSLGIMTHSIYTAIEPLLLKILHSMPPESAHNAAIWGIKHTPFIPDNLITQDISLSNLSTRVGNIKLSHPIGVAAGFDKNAQIYNKLLNFGFSFVEVGTVTPRAQSGNQKPRLFRFPEYNSIVNRMGFNNDGMEKISYRLQKRDKNDKRIVGVNIGANKDSCNMIDDYLIALNKLWDHGDYFVLNISSPNTENLRKLQEYDNFLKLAEQIMLRKRDLSKETGKDRPIWVKITSDTTYEMQEAIAEICLICNISAIIATNTTALRNDKYTQAINIKGGLSGELLFNASTNTLINMYKLTKGAIPIVASGGVLNATDAYEKICCGASAVQMYTGLVYNGMSYVNDVLLELSQLLKTNGFNCLQDAIASKVM